MPAPRVPPLAGSLLQLPFACRGVSPEQGTAALLPIALISRRHPPPATSTRRPAASPMCKFSCQEVCFVLQTSEDASLAW